MSAGRVTNEQVRSFWEANPVAAAAIRAEPGSAAYFASFDTLREVARHADVQRAVGFVRKYVDRGSLHEATNAVGEHALTGA